MKKSRKPATPAIKGARPGTLVWWLLVVVLAAVAVASASDMSRRLGELAAVPVVVDLGPSPAAGLDSWPPLPTGNCPKSRPEISLAGHDDLMSELEALRARTVQAESEARDLRLRNGLLRKYLDGREGEAQKAAWTPPTPAGAAGPGRAAGREPAARRPRVPIARSSTPKVQLIGSDAMVSGTVSNPGPSDLAARIDVELLLDGRRLARRRIDLLLPAGGKTPYIEIFPTSLRDGTYSARVFVEL